MLASTRGPVILPACFGTLLDFSCLPGGLAAVRSPASRRLVGPRGDRQDSVDRGPKSGCEMSIRKKCISGDSEASRSLTPETEDGLLGDRKRSRGETRGPVAAGLRRFWKAAERQPERGRGLTARTRRRPQKTARIDRILSSVDKRVFRRVRGARRCPGGSILKVQTRNERRATRGRGPDARQVPTTVPGDEYECSSFGEVCQWIRRIFVR